MTLSSHPLLADDVAELKVLVAIQQAQIRQQAAQIDAQMGQIQSLLSKGLAIKGNIDFGMERRQMLNLWNTEYGIGIQDWTQYFRTAGNFAFYKGGVHQNGMLDPGGGQAMMTIDGNGHVAAKSLAVESLSVAGKAPLTAVSCRLSKNSSTRPCFFFGGQEIAGSCYTVSCN